MEGVFKSQPRTLQEYTRIVQAGGVEVLPCVGEFVFVTAAAVEFRLVIGGKSFKLMQGDQIRVERFRDLELHNLSDTNDITITLVVGFGEFDRRIINGTVTMVPGVLRADGLYHPDTRHDLEMTLLPKTGSGVNVSAGDTVKRFADGRSEIISLVSDERRGILYGVDRRDSDNHLCISSYDPVTEAVSVLFDLDSFSGSVKTLAYDQGTELFYVGNNDIGGGPGVQIYNRLGAKVGSWTHDRSGTTENSVRALCFGSNGSLYMLTDERFMRLTKTGAILSSVGFPAGVGQELMSYQDEIWATESSFGNPLKKYDLDLVEIGNGFVPFESMDGATFLWYWIFWSQDSGSPFGLVQSEPFSREVPLLGVARDGRCPGPGLLAKPSDIDSARSDADVSVTWDRARAITRGEIIRLALEWYYRGSIVPSDYLDHVYAIEVLGTPLHDFATRSGLKLESPGRSFLAADIEDNFQVVMPARVRITVDADLDMG